MSQTVYLVIGASRGLGQGIVRQLSQHSSNHVIAATRNPVDFNKSNVENIVLDQSSSDSVTNAAAKVREVDVLIVNAAMGDKESLLSTSIDRFQQYIETNIVGVHRVVNAFVPALRERRTRKIIIVSSRGGSNTIQRDNTLGFLGPYSVTKAANNMQAVQYHNELSKEGFVVIALHPGWVATDMGSIVPPLANMGPMPVSKSAGDIIDRIQELKMEDSGKFFSHDGSILPW